MFPWTSSSEVDSAVKTIQRCLEITGSVPEDVVRGYWKCIEKANVANVTRFYEKLAEVAPEGLKYFSKRPIQADVE